MGGYGALWGGYGALWAIMGLYGAVWGLYGVCMGSPWGAAPPDVHLWGSGLGYIAGAKVKEALSDWHWALRVSGAAP